jgi:iron complex outermembrane receptor protein
MKKFLVLLLLFAPHFGAMSNPESLALLTGKVVDEENRPLIGVSVTIENSLIGVATNSVGLFSFNVKPGSYNVVFTYIGYKKKTVAVPVPNSSELVISMEIDPIMAEEVIVSATRASGRMPIAYTNIPKEELKSLNSGFDVPYLLELSPSVVATSEGGTGVGNTAIRIRGTDMTRINVTVNGIPLNDSESQGVYWVNMPDFASSVDNIQIQRGVGTSTNGAAAFGATVNFQTVTLEPKAYANVEGMAGSFGTLKTNARVGTGLINDAFSFEGRYTALQSNGYIDRGWSNHKSLFATGAWHRQNSLLRFNLIHGEQHTGITWEGRPSDSISSINRFNPELFGVDSHYLLSLISSNSRFNPAGIYGDNGIIKFYNNESDNYTQTHYQLLYSHQIIEALTFNFNLHYTKGAGYYEQYKPGQKFSKYGLSSIIYGTDTIKKTDLTRQKWLDNDFYGATFSANYKISTISASFGGGWNRYNGDHFGNILWTKVNSNIPNNYEWYRNNSIKNDLNLFAKATWDVTSKLSLFGDIQYRGIDYEISGPDDDLALLDQQHSWQFLNPKAGLSFSINANSNAYFSVGVANREPARADLKDAMKWGNAQTPKSERLTDYEMGYTFKAQKALFGVNIYYMNYKDQLVLTGKLSDVGYALMENVPKSYRRGVELSWGLLPTSWIKWTGTATFSQNKILNFVEYVDQYDNLTDWTPVDQKITELGTTNISFSPSVVAGSQIRIEPLKNLGVTLISKYVGSQYLDNTSNAARQLDAYFVNNVKVDYLVRVGGLANMRLEVYVNNLLNENYIANGWIYRAVFANGSPEYREDGYYPQAGINFMTRLAVEF